MWKRLHNSWPYYLLFIQDQNYDICVSDYVKIWTIQYNVDDFTTFLKECNLGLEIDTNELITNGIQMLAQPESLKSVDISYEVQHLKVSLSKSFGYPLKIKLLLKLGSYELFYQKVTLLLLKTVQDLRSSESELRFLLKNKDKEIEEYKAEAGEICLRYLKTKTYNDETHMKNHMLYDMYFGSLDISKSLQEKSVNSSCNTVIKQENVEIKTETSAQIWNGGAPVSEDIKIKQEIIIKNEPGSSIGTVKKRKIKLNI